MTMTAFKATSKRHWRVRFAWLIGFGYERSLLNKNGIAATEVVSWYLPLCVISSVQHFRKAN